MWYLHTVGYHSTKKGTKNVICCNIDRPRDCHTQWSRSENDRCDITYMRNLQEGCKWPSQNKSTVTDVENKHMATREQEAGG